MIVKIKKLHADAKIPLRNNQTDAGADLYSLENTIILPQSRLLIKTGISLEIPDGYYGRIAPRSGLAVKNGIDVLAGVVDSGYRGEIGVLLYNTDKNQSFEINKGDRIAQIIFEQHYNFEFVETQDLQDSNRSFYGFGSSGIK